MELYHAALGASIALGVHLVLGVIGSKLLRFLMFASRICVSCVVAAAVVSWLSRTA